MSQTTAYHICCFPLWIHACGHAGCVSSVGGLPPYGQPRVSPPISLGVVQACRECDLPLTVFFGARISPSWYSGFGTNALHNPHPCSLHIQDFTLICVVKVTHRVLCDSLIFLFLNNSGSGSEIQFLSEAQDDPQKRKPDIKKAKLMLGWEPVVSVAAPHRDVSHSPRPLLVQPWCSPWGGAPACGQTRREGSSSWHTASHHASQSPSQGDVWGHCGICARKIMHACGSACKQPQGC